MIASIENQFTQQYQEFKQIPKQCRDEYLQRIVKVPMQDTDFQMIQTEPTYYHTIQVKSSDQTIDLVIYVWQPRQKPKGLLYFAHGLNGHAGNMSQFMRQASVMSGFVAFGMDYRNFGRSGGVERGLIMDGLALVEDTEKVINWARDKYGEGLKVFLMGLSMGGAISIKVANRGQIGDIGGVIFVSPALKFNKFNPLPLSFIHYMKMLLMPRSYLFEPSFTSGCRHKKFIDKIKADKYLYLGKVRAGTIRCIGLWLRGIWDEVKKFKLPYLFIQSGVDKSVDPFEIIDFEQDCKSTDKTHFFAKDMWHSACFDKDIHAMLPDMLRWLEARV